MQKYIIISATNQNDIWEADVSASDDGFNPSSPTAHLFLSDNLPTDGRQLTIGPILTAVGWAIADALADADDQLAYDHAKRAQDLIRNAPTDVEIIVKLDVGGISRENAIARLTFGNDQRILPRRIPIAA